MTFAKWVFRIAGIWGVLVLTPLFFGENNEKLVPLPPINHPEYFYGFLTVTLAFQLIFFCISSDPIKYRLLMIPCMCEKFFYDVALLALFLAQRIPSQMLVAAAADLTLGVFFVAAFVKTKG